MRLDDDTLTTLMALNSNAHDLANLAVQEMKQRGISQDFKGDVLDTPYLSEALQNYYDAFRANVADLPEDVRAFFQLNHNLSLELSDFIIGLAKQGKGRTDIRQVPKLMRAFDLCISTVLHEDEGARLHRHFYLAAHDFTAQAYVLALRDRINASQVFDIAGANAPQTRTSLEEFDEFKAATNKLHMIYNRFSDEQKATLNIAHQTLDDHYKDAPPAPAETVEALMDMTRGNNIENIAVCGSWITRAASKKWRGMMTPRIYKS